MNRKKIMRASNKFKLHRELFGGEFREYADRPSVVI